MTDAAEVIRVEVPATGEHLRLARLVVAGAASHRDASLDDIEDLRLAVGEICAHLVAGAPDGARLSLEITVDPDEVSVRATAPCRDGAAPPDELMAVLLATVTDEHGSEPQRHGSEPQQHGSEPQQHGSEPQQPLVGSGCTMWFRRSIGARRPT